MSQKFIALFCCSIKWNRIVHLVICTERNFLVSAIYTWRTCINQMFHRVISAGFKDIIETDNVRFNICIRICDAVSNTCLCSKIYNNIRLIFCKYLLDQYLICKIALNECILAIRLWLCKFLDFFKAILLYGYIVIVIYAVKTDYIYFFVCFQKLLYKVTSDETGWTGD